MNLKLPPVPGLFGLPGMLALISGVACLAWPSAVNGQDVFPRPQYGEQAPDFQLKLLDGSEDRSLHEATRPTVLFFGSYS